MNILPRSSRSLGTRKDTAGSTLFVLILNAAVGLSFLSSQFRFPFATAFQLTPSTPPGEIIEQQLKALRERDMVTVYKFASPGNKQQTGDIKNFARMVQSGPYRFLVGHSRSEILLESKISSSRQYLVRVISPPPPSSPPSSLDFDMDLDLDDEDDGEEDLPSKEPKREKILEYWWSLSRCTSGEFTGSYMVDAVIPNQM